MYISSFKKIATRYKVIFYDSFGVIKNASGIIDGVLESIQYMRSLNKRCLVLTNDSSRSREHLAQYYHEKGLTSFTPADFISSGMLAKDFLGKTIKKGTIAYIGTKKSSEYLMNLGLKIKHVDEIGTSSHDIGELKAVVFLDDEGFEWRTTLNKLLNILRQTSIPVVVANSDDTYPIDTDNLSIAVGSLADMLESISGKYFIRFGKPDAQIFQYAIDYINQKNKNIGISDILMVGDTLTKDIVGAKKMGIDSALVLSGNTIPDQAEFWIKTLGIEPTYICESIAT